MSVMVNGKKSQMEKRPTVFRPFPVQNVYYSKVPLERPLSGSSRYNKKFNVWVYESSFLLPINTNNSATKCYNYG